MADLNNTIVRGKLRVTEDINANGNITGNGITLSSVKNAGILGTDSSGKVYNNSSAYQPKGDYVTYDNASKDIYLGSYGIHSGTRPSSGSATLMGNGYWIKPSSVGVSSALIGGTVPSVSSEITPDYVSISSGKIKLNTSGIVVRDVGTFTFDGNPGSVATSDDLKDYQRKGNYVTTDTAQTIIGRKTFNSPANVNGQEVATAIFKTSNGGQLIIGKEGPNSGTMLRFDQTAGTTRLQFRASATHGAMVWSQPEKGATLYFDLTNSAGVSTRTTLDARSGTIARTSDIKNGKITIQKNGTEVGSFTTNQSGSKTINLTLGIDDIHDLRSQLNGKANSSHTHSISQITNLQTSLDEKASKSDVSDIIETLKKKNKIYVLSSLTSDENIYINSGNRIFADKSAIIHLNMSEPSEAHPNNLYLVTGNEKKKVYPSELLLGDIIMTKDPEYPMRIITNIICHINNNSLLTSTTFTCTAVNSNDINDISQLKKDNEYLYRNSNSRVLTTSQDFGAKFGYVLLGTFNSSSRGSVNIHATYGDSGKRSAIEMNVSFDSSGKPTGYYTGTEANYDDGYCSLMTAPTEKDTSKLGLYMRLRGNVTYTIVINMPTNKNGGSAIESEAPFSIVNAYTMIYNDSSWDPAKAPHWTTIYQSSMKSIGDDMLKITGSSGFGDTNWHYRKIGHFIFNSSDSRNGAPVHLSGVIGNWAQGKMIFDIFVSTRGGLKVNGFVRGTDPSCRLVIDNTENPNIFLAVKGFATYNITVNTFENAQNENGAVRGCFHIDWTGGDDFTGSDVGVTATNFAYKDLLSRVAYQRAYYTYTGAFAETSGTMTKLCEVSGGETGKIICVHGQATSTNSELSIQRRATNYYDYDCIAIAPTGYNSGTYISCTGVVPPRLQYRTTGDTPVESTYYIFGKNVSGVYITRFDLP